MFEGLGHVIDLIHDSRHVGFQIVMKISHVLCRGANTGKKVNCGKSAHRNIELSTFYNNLHDNLKTNMAAIVNKGY